MATMESAHRKYNKTDKRKAQTRSPDRQERGEKKGGGCLSGKKAGVVPFASNNAGPYSEQGKHPERPAGSKKSGFTLK